MTDRFPMQAPYIALATFRRSGDKVATPVWCAAVDERLYVFSASNSGKVKRLRNSARAEVARCDMRGKLLGPWHDATAERVQDPGEIEAAHQALRRKYGWQMKLADIGAKLTGRYDQRAYIRIIHP